MKWLSDSTHMQRDLGIFGSSSNPGTTGTGSSSTSFGSTGNSGGGSSIWYSIFGNLGNILVGGSSFITAIKTDPNKENAANQSFLERLFAAQNAGNNQSKNTGIPSWVWIIGLLLIVGIVIMLVAKSIKTA